MSRVLRRPMFRGGIADSEGVGITSGLNDGYATGGRVNLQRGGISRIPGIDDLSQVGIYQPPSINFAAINPDTGLPYTQRDRLNLEPSIIDIARKEGIDLRKGTAREQVEATKLFEKSLIDKKAQELKNKALKDNKNNEPFVKENAPIKNLTSFYDEYMAMINKANLVDQDQLTKQKYLELAKFGFNLGKPTPAGIKPSLLGSIASAAEKPLEEYGNILTRESQMKQLPKQLALQASINAMAPGQIEKSIRELSKYMPLERAIAIVAKENTSPQRTLDMQEADYYSGKLSSMFNFLNKKENKGALDTAGQSFLNWKKIDPTLTFGQLSQIPADKDLAVDKKYYIGPNGTIVKFDKRGKQYLEASDLL